MSIAIALIFGYLMGSIPTSIWLGKSIYGVDVRKHGSGNAGGTNVFRVLGWKPAVVVILIDISKGVVPTLFIADLAPGGHGLDPVYLQLIAGLAAVAGHVWTLFAGFRGGKGVGTAAGMLIVLYPYAIPFCLAVFVLVVAVTRFVSLASILGVTTLPIVQWVLILFLRKEIPTPLLVLGFLLVPFVLFTHRSNIQRILNGSENRIGAKPAKPEPPAS